MSFIKFVLCTSQEYEGLANKDNGTLYRVQKGANSEDVYMGEQKLNGTGGSGVVVEDGVIKFDYSQI